MDVSRRGLLGMFAASAAAAIITTPNLLMRINPALVRAPYDPADYERYLRKIADELAAKRGVRYERIVFGPTHTYVETSGDADPNIWVPETPREGDTLTLNGVDYVFTQSPQAMRWHRPKDELLTVIVPQPKREAVPFDLEARMQRIRMTPEQRHAEFNALPGRRPA